MTKRLLSLLSLVLLIGAASAQTSTEKATYLNVELIGMGKQLQFQQAARLIDILQQAQQQSFVLHYPLATTLFDTSQQASLKSAALKQSVLKQLSQHNLDKHPLYQYISKHHFAPRLLSAIDIDDARLDKFNNPLLRGDLTLVSPTREEKVIYLGNLDDIYSVKDQAGVSLQQQTKNLTATIGELVNLPVLIYPDGHVIQPYQGSWLTTQYYLPPLTMVYVPFDNYATSELDQAIVQLLTQLKPTAMNKYL